jgi:hypothetical protein
MFRRFLRRRCGLSTWTVTVLAAVAGVAAAPMAATPAPAAVLEQSSPGTPVAFYEGQIETMVVRGTDDMLWRRERNKSESVHWQSWVNTGQLMRGDPAVERMLNGDPVVFWVAADGSEVRYQVKRGGAWQAAQHIPSSELTSNITFDGTPAVVAHNDTPYHADEAGKPVRSEGELRVFMRDTTGKLFVVDQTPNNSDQWTEWQNIAALPALVGNLAAAVDGNGSIGVFGRDQEGNIQAIVQARSRDGGLSWSRGVAGLKVDGLGPSDFDIAVTAVPHQKAEPGASQGKAESAGSLFQVFATNRNSEVWTATSQVSTPEAPNYQAAWNPPQKLVFDGQVQSAPVVASAGDGRTIVFALAGPDKKLALTGQTALPDPLHSDPAYHNGVWAAATNKPTGGDFTISSMSVVAGDQSRLEIYAMDTDKNLRFVSQLTAGSITQPEGWWLDWANHNPIGDPCANSGTLDCLTIASANPAGHLLQALGSGGRALARPPEPGYPGQRWQLVPVHHYSAGGLEGQFMIRNSGNGQCLGSWPVRMSTVRLAETSECDSTQNEQLWFLLPVMPNQAYDPHSEVPTRFRIGSVHNPNDCLVQNGGFWWCSKDTRDVENDDTVWTLGVNGGSAEGLIELATQHAANTCVNPNQAACAFVDHTTSSDIQPAVGCVIGKVLYNSPDAKDPFKYIPEWARGTGSELSVGHEIGVEFKVLNGSYSINHTWVQNEAHVDRFELPVPPGMYGWLELRPFMRVTTGHLQAPGDGWTWTVPTQAAAFVAGKNVEDYVAAVYAKSPPTQELCPHGVEPTST